MKVWVTRDKTDSVRGIVKVWAREPEKKDNSFFDPIFTAIRGWIIMSARDFKDSFGFTPRKGSCKQYELKIEKG